MHVFRGSTMRSRKWLANSKARFSALQALYQCEQLKGDMTLDDVRNEFIHYRFTTENYQPVDEDFFAELLRVWQEKAEVVDAYVGEHLASNWRLDRLASPLRALLRLVVTEVHYCSTTPPSVLWSEYQDLARAFVDEHDMAFVMKFMATLLPESRPKVLATVGESPEVLIPDEPVTSTEE